VGLGYLEKKQSATTLSGGEAQRVKISAELYRRHTEKTMYLLDEPTIGLHYEDVKKLIEILQELVNRGNTVMVIEHNLDLIKSADYVIDIGPEGGERGGEVVAKGTPEDHAQSKQSYTGK
jgi:excinuclease ABC subunit A